MRIVSILPLIALGICSVSAQVAPFVEPDDGRAPVTDALDAASQSIDIFLFRLTDNPITASLVGAVARGVTVRALLEPCPGDTACDPPVPEAIAACNALQQGGVQVKWANPAFRKTHAKTVLIDGAQALVTTLNMVPNTFASRRDYGVATNDAGVIADLNQVFTQDWQNDDPIMDCNAQRPADRPSDDTIQDYATLIVSPDHGREQMLGLISSAQSSLKIHMEKIDPQNGRGIIPAIVAAIRAGVRVQVVLTPPEDEPDNLAAANAINAAGGEARFQRNPRPHAKMIVIDGQEIFVGSQNLTRTSLDERREIGWVTNDDATLARFQQVFEMDWSTGTTQ
jgi:cardiolipin synthase